MSEEPKEVEIPSMDQMVQQFMHIIDQIELARTGAQESIDYCLWFCEETVKAGAAMLDNPDVQAVVRNHIEETLNVKLVDKIEEEGGSGESQQPV